MEAELKKRGPRKVSKRYDLTGRIHLIIVAGLLVKSISKTSAQAYVGKFKV